MAITEDPIHNSDRVRSSPWNSGSATGGPFLGKRIVPTVDKIRAQDINDLRDQLELLIGHTHEYTDNAGGGGTTTTCF